MMTVLTRLTPVTPGAISDPGIQNANRPLTISEIDSNFSDLYNFVYGKLANTTDTFTGTLSIAGQLRFNGSVSGYVGFQSASTTANVLYTLPTSDGLNGQVISTNGTGTLSWINQAAGGGGGSGSGTSTSRTAFTATAGQTTFSVTYVVGQIDVYMNGSKLIVGTEVTASNGTSIVLAEAASAGDIVEAVVYSTQWISSGSNLYYDQGNVGFGVTNPAARIHVGSAATALATGTLRIDGADGAGTVNAPVTLNSVTDGATASGGSQFYIETRAPGGTLTEKFRIDGDGNVGINNNNPQSALDVTGNVRISGSTTLSGGTANGVLYLNGSKVATSGSALTFDGTTFVNTVGGVSAKSAFELSGGANAIKTLYLSNYADAAANWNYIRSSSGLLDIYATGSNSLAFGASGTEQMRLTSTGLGIGTSSPSTKLTVRGVTFTDNGVTGGASGLVYAISASSGGNFGQIGNTGTRWSLGYGPSLTALGTEVLVWDASGNVGIGTSSPATKLDVVGAIRAVTASTAANNLRVGNTGNSLFLGVDSSTGGTNIVGSVAYATTLATNTAIQLSTNNGASVQATLDASGNLLLGLSGALANGKLQIAGGIGLSGNTQIRQATNFDGNTLQVFATQFVAGPLNSSSYGYEGGGLVASVSNNDNSVLLDVGRITSTWARFKILNTIGSDTALSLEKNGVYTLYADTGSSNLGIGTSSPGQKLTVIGAISLGSNDATQSARIQIADGQAGATDARFLFRNGTDTNAALRLILNSASNVSIDAVQANNTNTPKDLILQTNGGNVGIGDSSPTNRLTINGGIRVGSSERVVIGWFQGDTAGSPFPGTPAYYHIKTSLWAGSNPTGNTQPTMSLVKVTGYDYNGQTILAMMGFHNWSGSLPSLTTQNLGQRDIGLTGLVSTDGYVVLRINVSGASYQAWSIDWHQTWPYTWVDIKVTGTALSSATNYY